MARYWGFYPTIKNCETLRWPQLTEPLHSRLGTCIHVSKHDPWESPMHIVLFVHTYVDVALHASLYVALNHHHQQMKMTDNRVVENEGNIHYYLFSWKNIQVVQNPTQRANWPNARITLLFATKLQSLTHSDACKSLWLENHCNVNACLMFMLDM